jgi:hypothetical protein
VQYRKDRDGMVHVIGTATRAAGDYTSAGGTIMFTLPTGYRPAASHAFSVASHDGTFGWFSTPPAGFVSVAQSGDVQVWQHVDDRYVHLGHLEFPAA